MTCTALALCLLACVTLADDARRLSDPDLCWAGIFGACESEPKTLW